MARLLAEDDSSQIEYPNHHVPSREVHHAARLQLLIRAIPTQWSCMHERSFESTANFLPLINVCLSQQRANISKLPDDHSLAGMQLMLNMFDLNSNATTSYVLWYHRYLSSVFDLINIGSFSSCYPYMIMRPMSFENCVRETPSHNHS